MERLINEQMLFFGESVCLGVLLGILLGIFSGLGRNLKRVNRFWLDVLFGPLAGIILFLGSLVIMDGQLHPFLLLGALVGMLLVYMTVGVYLSGCVSFLYNLVSEAAAFIDTIFTGIAVQLSRYAGLLCCYGKNLRKKLKKKENNT